MTSRADMYVLHSFACVMPARGESLLKHKDPFWGEKLDENRRKIMLRCSNSECKNHTPNNETRFNWSMPFVQVTSDRVIVDDVKTEIAYCFTCPLCRGDAEDFDTNEK